MDCLTTEREMRTLRENELFQRLRVHWILDAPPGEKVAQLTILQFYSDSYDILRGLPYKVSALNNVVPARAPGCTIDV